MWSGNGEFVSARSVTMPTQNSEVVYSFVALTFLLTLCVISVIADSTACSRALHREGAELLSAFQSVSHLLPHQFLSRQFRVIFLCPNLTLITHTLGGRPSELIERPELMYLVHDYEQTIASLKEAVADGPDSLQDYIGAKEEAHNLIKKVQLDNFSLCDISSSNTSVHRKEVSLCIEWDKKEANRRFVEYTSIRAKRKEAYVRFEALVGSSSPN